jgi:hypothetical protein
VPFFYFDRCIVCLSSILTVVLCAFQRSKYKKGTQYNGQNRKKARNTTVKIEDGHTIQRSKQKKGTQYNGQNKRKAHNTTLSSIFTVVLCAFLLF